MDKTQINKVRDEGVSLPQTTVKSRPSLKNTWKCTLQKTGKHRWNGWVSKYISSTKTKARRHKQLKETHSVQWDQGCNQKPPLHEKPRTREVYCYEWSQSWVSLSPSLCLCLLTGGSHVLRTISIEVDVARTWRPASWHQYVRMRISCPSKDFSTVITAS